MIIYTKNVMKYITVLLLAVFLIPLVQNVNAQNPLDQLGDLISGGGQSANNTAQEAGQNATSAGQSMNNTAQEAGQNATSAGQSTNNGTGGAGGLGDMLGNLIPGQ
jgi:hypothetical protein